MYIDPAAGSMVLQLLAAGLFSAAAMTKSIRTAVMTFFRSLRRRQPR